MLILPTYTVVHVCILLTQQNTYILATYTVVHVSTTHIHEQYTYILLIYVVVQVYTTNTRLVYCTCVLSSHKYRRMCNMSSTSMSLRGYMCTRQST